MDDAAAFPGDEARTVVRYGLPLRVIVSAAIVFQIVAVLVWLLPASRARGAVSGVTDQYINYAGLWQSWGMFAPEPANLNLYVHALITYRNGSQREWSFPRMNQIDLFNRYRLERYRKYEEYAHLDTYSLIWPDLARWVAAQNPGTADNPPVLVTLIRTWWEIPAPPANGDISHDPPHTWSSFTFFQLPLQPGYRP